MSNIDRQVRRVRFRMASNLLMHWLTLGVTFAAAAWAVVIVAERSFVLGIPIVPLLWANVIAAGLIGVIGAYVKRIDALRAAMEIDAAAGLKERVSSAVAFAKSDDPFARAAVRDADRIAGGVHVPSHIPLRWPQPLPWSIALAVVAAILFGFMPTLDLLAATEPEPKTSVNAVPVLSRGEMELAIKEKRERTAKRLENKPHLAGLKDELAALELPKDPDLSPEDIRRDVVKKIERVSDKIDQQLEDGKLQALDALKKELSKLESQKGDDPSSKLSEALSKGDMQGAKKALDDLKEELKEAAESAKDNPEAQAKLAEMQKKLDDLSEQLQKLGDTQKMQKELENKAGLSEEDAKKLIEQMSKMDPKQLEKALQQAMSQKGKPVDPEKVKELAKKLMQQQQVQQQLKQMAQAMQKAAKSCKQCQNGGDGQQAAADGAAALSQASDQMSQLEMAEQMMNELQAELGELDQLKQGVCEANAQCMRPGESDQIGGQGPQAGLGYGAQTGKKAAAHGYKPTKVQSQMQGGEIIGQMLVDGPQLRGEASAEARDAVNSAVRDATDAIEREEVPRQYERVLRNYFLSLAGLDVEKKPAGDKPEEGEQTPDDKAGASGS